MLKGMLLAAAAGAVLAAAATAFTNRIAPAKSPRS